VKYWVCTTRGRLTPANQDSALIVKLLDIGVYYLARAILTKSRVFENLLFPEVFFFTFIV